MAGATAVADFRAAVAAPRSVSCGVSSAPREVKASLSPLFGRSLSISHNGAKPQAVPMQPGTCRASGPDFVAAAQVVTEKPQTDAAAASTAPLATGLLDGKDPAWKMGTESKARLKAYYESAVVPALKAEFGYTNPQEVPYVEKIVVNCGIGDASQSSKVLEAASKDLALVTGQRPVVTRSRKAIAGFKLREGVPVGMAATLRGQVMYSYLDRLLNLALPRVRDFRGVSKGGFDGRGNFSMGLAEQTMYPEIQFDQIDATRGMDISIVTTARTDREAQRLLELLGMPFKEGPVPAKERPKAKGRGGAKGGRGGKQQTKAKKKK